MSELKPCPFCGGEAVLCYDASGHGEVEYLNLDCISYYAYCTECEAKGERETEAEAIAAWNARPLEAALEARVAELEAANLELQKSLVDVTHKYILATEAAESGDVVGECKLCHEPVSENDFHIEYDDHVFFCIKCWVEAEASEIIKAADGGEDK